VLLLQSINKVVSEADNREKRMVQVRVVLRAPQFVREGCDRARKNLRDLNIGIHGPLLPLEVSIMGPLEMDEEKYKSISRAIEGMTRQKKMPVHTKLGPVTHDGHTKVFFPIERDVVRDTVRKLCEKLDLPYQFDEECQPQLMVAQDSRGLAANFHYVVNAFVETRPRRPHELIPFGIAVLTEKNPEWREEYVLG